MTARPQRKSIAVSLIAALAVLLLLSTFVMAHNVGNDAKLLASAIWTLYLGVMTFMILRTGRTTPWRSIFFIVYAFSFVFIFTGDLIAERGSMALTREIIAANGTPLCPVAIPQLVLPAVLRKLLIFPTQIVGGPYGGFWAIVALWLVALLALGRGWCSWGCFYGGLDEGFSKVLHKPLVSTKRLPPRLRYLPHAVLVVVVLLSFQALEPVYCQWLCPLKLVTEYPAVDSPVAYLQAVIFITLGMGLLVILPVLTKKRTQCGLFCPLGALQSVLSPASPYRVRIDAEACRGCGACRAACPTFSIVPGPRRADPPAESGGAAAPRAPAPPHISNTCTRCGDCMDTCPEHAIQYALVGVPALRDVNDRPRLSFGRRLLRAPWQLAREICEARTLFVCTAVIFGATLSGDYVTRALVRLYELSRAGLSSLLLGLGVG